jgi:hypothetical protein
MSMKKKPMTKKAKKMTEKPVVEGGSEMEWSENRRGNFVVTSM